MELKFLNGQNGITSFYGEDWLKRLRNTCTKVINFTWKEKSVHVRMMIRLA